VITECGEERLIPEWMFHTDAFDSNPVDLPLIHLDALRHLIRIVLSSGLCSVEQGQEGQCDAPTQPVSATSGSTQTTARRRAKRRSQSAERPACGGDDGEIVKAKASRRKTRGTKR